MTPPTNALTIQRVNATTGALIETISATLVSCVAEYKLYGGCYTMAAAFAAQWGDAPLFGEGDGIRLLSNGVAVWFGRVVRVVPEYAARRQAVSCEGWWARLAEIEILADATQDHITFGNVVDSDFPAVTTVSALVARIVSTYITPDASPIAAPSSTVGAAAVTCKFGEFVLYASDRLPEVIENLAAMDDCVCGIDADGNFYFLPRATLEAAPHFTFRAAEGFVSGWQSSGTGIAIAGQFVYDRTGPNQLDVISRDVNGANGIRRYKYAGALDVATRRLATWYAPQVRAGQGARRLARGIFRRYATFGLRVERLECVIATQRFEPHLGAANIYDGGALVLTELAGTISVTWTGPLRVAVTIGENATDPGGGQPINDPWAYSYEPPDTPQIDTGTELPYSWDIDDADGYDGDGDDLHSNDDRFTPDDPAGVGVDAVDYGTDLTDDTNGRASGGGGGGTQVWPAKITADNGNGTFGIEVYESDRATVYATHFAASTQPQGAALNVDDEVTVYYASGASTPIIDASGIGASGAGETRTLIVGYTQWFS